MKKQILCPYCHAPMLNKKQYYSGLIFILIIAIAVSCYAINNVNNKINKQLDRIEKIK